MYHLMQTVGGVALRIQEAVHSSSLYFCNILVLQVAGTGKSIRGILWSVDF